MNYHKSQTTGCNCPWGTRTLLFGEMPCGLMKQKLKCLAVMTIVMYGNAASYFGGASLQEGLVQFTK